MKKTAGTDRNKRMMAVAAACMSMAIGATGCGSMNRAMTPSVYSSGMAYDGSMDMSSAANGSNGMAKSSAVESAMYEDYADSRSDMSEADIVKSNMMIVRNANVSVDVGNLEEFTSNVTKMTEEFGGYFENKTVNNYDSDYSTDRYAYYTIRIPEKNLDAFLNVIDGESTIRSRNVTAEDVSLEYSDTTARLNTLKTEKENLLRLMDKAEDVEDIINIENRLSEVQYELDSTESRKRLLEGRVEYSTVHLDAHEERNVEHPIMRALTVNFRDRAIEGVENAARMAVDILTSIPTLIIGTMFALAFLWVLIKALKFMFKRKGNGRRTVHYVLTPVYYDTPEPLEPETRTGQEMKEQDVKADDDGKPETDRTEEDDAH